MLKRPHCDWLPLHYRGGAPCAAGDGKGRVPAPRLCPGLQLGRHHSTREKWNEGTVFSAPPHPSPEFRNRGP